MKWPDAGRDALRKNIALFMMSQHPASPGEQRARPHEPEETPPTFYPHTQGRLQAIVRVQPLVQTACSAVLFMPPVILEHGVSLADASNEFPLYVR